MLFPKAYYRFNVIGKCCHRSGTQELAAEPTLFTFAYFEKSIFMELTDMEKWLLYQIKGYEQYAVC